ncbi:anthranilate phosphoribosyltransferase [Hyphobacterium marinum]|uniref:Anthranilate phosphoribosyltransferase n=1 Tax=Hyphobacterium marinum TaxID=3116574 RepID=A0ABU7M127_9PROT|nr:anthranilate phosphoribosyltransferase [Hyphobacterium sp. Y6023]MEE2567518.1 anthranilate phosphoribosyltransferase [Hyphobacterium sp. Y6023]
MSALLECIQAFTRGERPAAEAIAGAFSLLMEGDAGDAEIGGFLIGLAAIGETPDDLAAGATALRARMTGITAPDGAIDTCGTGGDARGTYNISTAAAIVAAGAGARVAKHGNRAASSKSGSAEVLAELGVAMDAGPARVERALNEANVGFLFAPAHHSAVRHVAAARKALRARTVFNLLGPLANPAGTKRQLLGVFDDRWLEPVALALNSLGAERAWVVRGRDGLDEITTTGLTDVVELKDGSTRRFTVSPEDAGLPAATLDDLVGGTPQENAQAMRALLDGAPGAYRDIVVLNAAAALVIAGLADDLKDGAAKAQSAIDSGAAKSALERMAAISRGEA